MPRGGKRPGAGRPKGAFKVRASMRKIIDRAADAGQTPLEYMLNVMNDTDVDIRRRDAMAMAAAPYVHPRLAAILASTDRPRVSNITVEFVAPDGYRVTPDGRVIEGEPLRIESPDQASDADKLN